MEKRFLFNCSRQTQSSVSLSLGDEEANSGAETVRDPDWMDSVTLDASTAATKTGRPALIWSDQSVDRNFQGPRDWIANFAAFFDIVVDPRR